MQESYLWNRGAIAVSTAPLAHASLGDISASRRSGLAQVFERGGFGVLICTAAGRVLTANRVAQSILALRRTLTLRDGHLRAMRRSDDARLRDAMAGVTQPRPRHLAAREIALSIPCSTGLAPLGVLVAAFDALADDEVCGEVLVLLKSRRAAASLTPAMLVSGYGFTRREARVAAEIANGSSVHETALSLNIAEQTVRKHLRKLFEKTGTGRQAELVGMLQSGVEVFASHPEHDLCTDGAPVVGARARLRD